MPNPIINSGTRNFRRLALHASGGALAWAMSGVFSAVFLLRTGLTAAQIFLAFAAILALRFALRPLVLYSALTMGLRRTFILGALIYALQGPALALVDGMSIGLLIFVVLSSLGQVFYCTSYHVFFAAVSAGKRRGTQVGAFQALGNLAAVVGPAAGGFLLAARGPWYAFGASFLIALAAIVPLLHIAEPPVEMQRPRGAYMAASAGIKLFFADGWIQVSMTTAWSIVLFQALHDRYDSFGDVLSLAALAGALGGIVLGRVIDMGRARSAVLINAVVLGLIVVLRAVTFGNATVAVAVAIGTSLLGGLYVPSWLTAAYNEAKAAPCSFRFQFAAEGGWDAGGVCAGLAAAALCGLGLPAAAAVLLALPMVPVQAVLLNHSYTRRAAMTADPQPVPRQHSATFA